MLVVLNDRQVHANETKLMSGADPNSVFLARCVSFLAVYKAFILNPYERNLSLQVAWKWLPLLPNQLF